MVNTLVGLTGGIGSGKSTAADLFAELGARVVDTDLISHALTQPGGAAIPAIRATFGNNYIAADGSMDRRAMRELVFSEPDKKRQLEAILHPLILEQSKAAATSPTQAPYTLVVVPLLFESPRYADWLHPTIAVDCSEEVQLARTMQRSKLSESAVRAIMAQQISRNARRQKADHILDNSSSLESLRQQVAALHLKLSAFASKND